MLRLRSLRRLFFGLSAFVGGVYVLLWKGSLTLDLGIGRRSRRLGPLVTTIDAPRDIVFDVIASPYLDRTPKAMEDKLIVLERGSDVVLADHRTQVGPIVTSTVEVVSFERPAIVRFRLVRGPVRHVTEIFVLDERDDGGTTLTYSGEMQADLWALGSWWIDKVASYWEPTVERSLADIRTEAERRSSRH